MKFHAVYGLTDVFDTVQNLQLFEICKKSHKDRIVIWPESEISNYVFPIVQLLYQKMQELHCKMEELKSENYVLELWDKSFITTENDLQNQLQQKIHQSSPFSWHSDDYGILSYPVYTCIVYFSKGDGIEQSNLLIKDSNDNIQLIDVWSQKTVIIFDGDVEHCAQQTVVTDPSKECHRQVLVFLIRKKMYD